MIEKKIGQATLSENTWKRIYKQPEKTVQHLSDSKILSLLIEEALNSREKAKNVNSNNAMFNPRDKKAK